MGERKRRSEVNEKKWYADLAHMPRVLRPDAWYIAQPVNCFANEKDAINHARKRRIAEIDRLQVEVNELDARYDFLEDQEMAADLEQRMKATRHLDVTYLR